MNQPTEPSQPRPPRAISIRIEYDDGTVLTAEGEHASDIWDWLMGAETLFCIHGAKYSGKPFTKTMQEKFHAE